MRMMELGRTGLKVSELCLGTMTWGSQNSEAEAHAQIDRSLEAGINFMDTAEMYPVTPMSAETTGRTEEIIGTWNAKSGRRADWVIATKIAGAGAGTVRSGEGITATSLPSCIEPVEHHMHIVQDRPSGDLAGPIGPVLPEHIGPARGPVQLIKIDVIGLQPA
ncbi:MAG: aldo/keto reductase, partial [Pseudomonadota bacterium]